MELEGTDIGKTRRKKGVGCVGKRAKPGNTYGKDAWTGG